MALFCRIVQPQDLDEILDFENKKLAEQMPVSMERRLTSFNARKRNESLGK